MMRFVALVLGALLAGLAAPAAADLQALTPEEAERLIDKLAEEARLKASALTFEQFEATVYKEKIPNGKYIVNGDTPIPNKKKLREFFESNIKAKAQKDPKHPEFTVLNVGGLDVVWNGNVKRRLTYCVSSAFSNKYGAVVAAMNDATAAWEAVADIDFIHLSAVDNQCDARNQAVLFDVRPVSGERYLARAFFPNDLREDRNVLIESKSFTLDPNGKLQLVGIIRHELGHAIGARHEHVRPEAGDCFEDSDWRAVTNYDAFSVMHYPQCNGAGDWSLVLTASDANGAACLYGPAPGANFDSSTCGNPGAERIAALKFENQQVGLNEIKRYDSVDVAPGTSMIVTMRPSQGDAGDADLYLAFDKNVGQASYDCRPFHDTSAEVCDVVVPAGQGKASLMVRGFTAARYELDVQYSKK